MKQFFICLAGTASALVSAAVGGWDHAIITLLTFMVIDYITGWVVAVVFKKSHKTDSGGYSSAIGLKGLCKKCMVLLLVVVANMLDVQLGANYVRDGVCIAFIVNEVMSIIENAGLMGIPVPAVITKVLDVLTEDKEV